jgi:hypothetical protein
VVYVLYMNGNDSGKWNGHVGPGHDRLEGVLIPYGIVSYITAIMMFVCCFWRDIRDIFIYILKNLAHQDM